MAAEVFLPVERASSYNKGELLMSNLWKWVYAAGLVIAGVAGGLGFSNQFLGYLLLLAAILCGLLYFDPDDFGQFGLRVLALWVAKEGFGAVPAVGSFFNGFFAGLLGFLYPVILAMVLRFLWSKRLAPLFS
jgi:hypothetical protein